MLIGASCQHFVQAFRERQSVTAFLAPLRDGHFLTRQRLTAYPVIFLTGFAVAIVWLIVTAHGLNDYSGRPLGTDFSSFHASGQLALSGQNPFDQQALYRAEQTAFGHATPYYAFAYPPVFLLLTTALAALPYAAALALWLSLTFLFYLAAMAALQRAVFENIAAEKTQFFLAVIAFPAVFINLTHGQNGFLSAALLTFGLAFLERRPLLAGLCFGLLCFKPQLGLLIPFALAAGGRWKSFTAATATVLLLILSSAALFGVESWQHFLAAAQFSRVAILDGNAVGYEKMVSVFAAARLWHAPLALAYGLQAIMSLTALFLTLRLWRGAANMRLKGAALCLGTLLVTPFSMDYDLMLLAPALLLVAAEGKKRGFRPYELSLLTLLWLLPLVGRSLAGATHILLAPFAILALLLLIGRRAEA